MFWFDYICAFSFQVNVEEQISLVGGLIGLVNFCTEVLQQGTPSVVSLTTCKFAVLATGTFILVSEIVISLVLATP